MVKSVQVTMYVDEVTGKMYKDFIKAEKAELKSKNILILRKFAESLGYKTLKHFRNETLPETQFLNWISENNYKVFNNSEQKTTDQLFYYALNNFTQHWTSYTNVEQEAENIYKQLSEKILALEEVTVYYYVDNRLVLEDKTKNVGSKLEKVSPLFDESNKFKYDEVRTGQTLKVYYKELTEKSVSEKYEALNNFNVSLWPTFKNALDKWILDKIKDVELTDEETLEALENGGVDNWDGYEYAIELANDDDYEWLNLSSSQKMNYLRDAKVSNWEWIEESIDNYKEQYYGNPEVEEEDFVKIFETIVDKYEWGNYPHYIKFLYK